LGVDSLRSERPDPSRAVDAEGEALWRRARVIFRFGEVKLPCAVHRFAAYAWTDVRDLNHHVAVQRLQGILDQGEELLTHNYVVLEAVSLLQARLGRSAALKLAKDSTTFVIE
jgi:hypothetical protein